MEFRNEYLTIPCADLGGENPLPAFRTRKPKLFNIVGKFPKRYEEGAGVHMKVLPYTVQDRYNRTLRPTKLKCLTLENEYLRAKFLPEYGGRLHSLYDKKRAQELLFTNTVIQPANLAIRNAWLSGGIEWNIGSIGHTYTTCDNVYAAELSDGEGNTFIRIYEFERLKSIFWQADFHLPEGSPHLMVHVKMVNPFPVDTTTYWWSNIAVTDNGRTRVFNSGENAVCVVGTEMSFGKIPYELECMPCDVSYPSRAARSFDFFVQENSTDECTWEASSYDNGTLFYERSTPPLLCKKLYTWGNHAGGRHWQEYLSEPGKGYYAELQAGIAPSQLHDKIFPANTVYEWTQCFGGTVCDTELAYSDNYFTARAHVGEIINSRISADDILALDKKLAELARLPVSADQILHTGSGFGAVEAIRMARDGDGDVPASMCFPESAIGKKEYPWRHLIENGTLPENDPRHYTVSFMTSEKWLPHISASLEREGGRSWYSLMHYGIAIYDGANHTKYAADAYSDEDNTRRCEAAEAAWLESVSLTPSIIVYRNLAVLELQRGNTAKAVEYYDKALALPGINDDLGVYAEYLLLLAEIGESEKGWKIYSELPENLKSADRIRIASALLAVKLEYFEHVEKILSEPFITIREGEETPTDIWGEMETRKLARSRGLEPTPELLSELTEEIWATKTPPAEIDFRQSTNREIKYR
ncbi:MAG: DUF5107 domain-containing protein [Clostridia bacterium]|nr:DUF5107 domain-containing protein [Clostridia bacterium]